MYKYRDTGCIKPPNASDILTKYLNIHLRRAN